MGHYQPGASNEKYRWGENEGGGSPATDNALLREEQRERERERKSVRKKR